MISIILTNDYEIFGNGEGDVSQVMIEPTRKMLDICEDSNVPMTLFWDLIEWYRFIEAEREGWFEEGYMAGTMIRNQLIMALRAGHDIQIHMHPQWINANPIHSCLWEVSVPEWRVSDMALRDPDDPNHLIEWLKRGKKAIEEIAEDAGVQHACVAFRAGGYSIQPSAKVLAALRDCDIPIDSSVCPGRISTLPYPKNSDFSRAPRNIPYWRITDDVTVPSDNGWGMEIPILTGLEYCGIGNRRRKISSLINRYWRKRIVNADYCHQSAKSLLRMIDNAIHHCKSNIGLTSIPVVLTGHAKSFSDSQNLSDFINLAQKRSDITFTTYTKWFFSNIDNL